jgi:outer membrane immunogenic protein
MKPAVLAIAITAISAMPVLAADLPNRAPPPYIPPVPVFTWTGFYGGFNIGGIFTNSPSISFSGDPVFVGPAIRAGSIPTRFSNNEGGFFGGGQIGYNWQVGAFVWGLETDFQGTTLTKKAVAVGPLATATLKDNLPWFGTTRGRLGYAFYDRWMGYVTGGLAYGEEQLQLGLTDRSGTLFGGRTLVGTRNTTQVGWTIGAGLEWAFAQNWSAKLEYLYYDLGSEHVIATNRAFPAASSTLNFDQTGNIVRAGINYKFW